MFALYFRTYDPVAIMPAIHQSVCHLDPPAWYKSWSGRFHAIQQPASHAVVATGP